MSLIGCVTKLGFCFAVAGGLIAFPQFHTWFPKEREKVNWTLGKSERGGSGLFLEDMEKVEEMFETKKKARLSVSEVGLKFGDRKVSSKDILKRPCEEGIYYLLKDVGDRLGRYELKPGVLVHTLRCGDKNLYKGVENVKLEWTRPRNRGETLTTIRLSDCFFTRDRNNHLQIICNEKQWDQRLQFTFKNERQVRK